MRSILKQSLLGVSLVALSVPAYAQTAPAADDEAPAEDEKQIVVTGTLIRGGAPVGSNAISIGPDTIQETAAQSSNELLASIPQVTNFFNAVPVADLAIATNQIQIARPNLRSISNASTASSPTLILVDGHRIPTAGVKQASVDPDLIPISAIARVEVMTEGGSATYGADAVAGVINFITHRRYDGVKVDAHYGFADNYWQWDASAIVGKAWDNGSIWAAYSYTENDALFGRDRDYVRNLNYTLASRPGLDTACVNGNFAVNTVLNANGAVFSSVTYPRPGLVAGPPNLCDNSENSAFIPSAKRHGAMVGLDWDFGESTSLTVRGYYGQRDTSAPSVLTASVPVNANNANTTGNIPGGLTLGPVLLFGFLPATNVAAMNFSFESILGLDSKQSTTSIREWGANAELKHEFAGGWQVRALANWGESDSRYNLTGVGSALNAASAPAVPTSAANAFNPFNLSANSPALLATVLDSELAGQARDRLINLRLIAEGKLFTLPGGDVRVALGYEYMDDRLERRERSDIKVGTLGTFPFVSYSRNVHSLFGELRVPLFADASGDAIVTISAQGRYDKYSDFGETFNPKFGATIKVSDRLSLRGNWGTSFTAPTPLDQLGSLSGSISSFGFVPFVQPGSTLLGGSNNTIAFQGSQAGLQPQTADTWSVGFDAEPFDRLKISASYYDVNFDNILGTPTPNAGIFAEFPANVLYDVNGLTTTQINNFFGASTLAPSLATQLSNTLTGLAGGRVVELVDFRVGNFGVLHVKGMDGSVSFSQPTSWGGFDLRTSWNVQFSRLRQASPTAAAVDEMIATGISPLNLQVVAGVDIGGFRAQATWNHSAGYNLTPLNSLPVQSDVDSFNTVNLFFKYDFAGDSMVLKDLTLTLNVSNVFDQDPPALLRSNPGDRGYANGSTVGRMVIFGVSKKF
jgi:iron complex outermembrane receptor protein